jgi:hypothetical protein
MPGIGTTGAGQPPAEYAAVQDLGVSPDGSTITAAGGPAGLLSCEEPFPYGHENGALQGPQTIVPLTRGSVVGAETDGEARQWPPDAPGIGCHGCVDRLGDCAIAHDQPMDGQFRHRGNGVDRHNTIHQGNRRRDSRPAGCHLEAESAAIGLTQRQLGQRSRGRRRGGRPTGCGP